MIRKFKYLGAEILYEDSKVTEYEARETLIADIDATNEYFSSEGRKWPTLHEERLVPIYGDVEYILTDIGWISNQRADIIKQIGSLDYKIITPTQIQKRKEIVRYKRETYCGSVNVPISRAVQLYWFYTNQIIADNQYKIISNSKYKLEDKPIEYITDDEFYILAKTKNPIILNFIEKGLISQEEIHRILEELETPKFQL